MVKGSDVILVALNPSGIDATAKFDLNIPFTQMNLPAEKELKFVSSGSYIQVVVRAVSYAIYRIIRKCFGFFIFCRIDGKGVKGYGQLNFR